MASTKRQFLAGLALGAATLGGGPVFGQQRPGFPPTNTDEAKVRSYTLPDPLVMTDGSPVTDDKAWLTRRRPELLRLFEDNQFGRTPKTVLRPRYQIIDSGTPALGATARRTQLRIRFSDAATTPFIRVMLHVPAKARGPVPTLLYIGFSPAVQHADEPGVDLAGQWDIKTKTRVGDREQKWWFTELDPRRFIERGYGIAYVYNGDIDPDFEGGASHGVRALFGPQSEPRGSTEWGTIGAWSWGVSRVLDYLQTNPAVDGAKVALAGFSRMGKTAIWAGAQDERFAVVMPLMSGEGGAAISRRNYGETVADLMNPVRIPYWFAPAYDSYSKDVDRLPVDGHMLVALAAPRPILLTTGSTDTWSDPKGEFVSALAAEPVYRLFGKKGVGLAEYPQPETRIISDIGYYVHNGGHLITSGDHETMLAFMDAHLAKPATS